MAAELPEAGMVAHCVAVGRAAILEPLLSFLERVATTRRRDFTVVLLVPVVSLALALGVLTAYLLLAIVAIVIERGDVTPELKQAAAALSAAVLGWLRNLTSIKLTIAFRIFGFEIDMIWDILLAART